MSLKFSAAFPPRYAEDFSESEKQHFDSNFKTAFEKHISKAQQSAHMQRHHGGCVGMAVRGWLWHMPCMVAGRLSRVSVSKPVLHCLIYR